MGTLANSEQSKLCYELCLLQRRTRLQEPIMTSIDSNEKGLMARSPIFHFYFFFSASMHLFSLPKRPITTPYPERRLGRMSHWTLHRTKARSVTLSRILLQRFSEAECSASEVMLSMSCLAVIPVFRCSVHCATVR